MNIGTPKGTRDFSPAEMARRNYIFDSVRKVFEQHGYLPIETPAFENSSTLMGKYGEEGDRLIFKILNSGDYLNKIAAEDLEAGSNRVATKISEKALRYDLTVPFARYVVQHRNDITFPFKRYQIQPVWRADRPQKGRYREFYQCDVDVIGSNSLLNEVDLVMVVDDVFNALNIPVTLKINNRKLLAASAEVIGEPDRFLDITVALDKLDKIGEEKVMTELSERGIPSEGIEKLRPLMQFTGDTKAKLEFLMTYLGENETGKKGLAEVTEVLNRSKELSSDNTIIELDLTLARGLNYYTGAIFEVKSDIEGSLASSITGGGRYDDLTGIFGLKDVSGVGISFGADRIYDVMLEADLFPADVRQGADILFINFGEDEAAYCLKLVRDLQKQGARAELFPDLAKMKKQMTYANNNAIPWVAMVGSNEMAHGTVSLKNMKSGEQQQVETERLLAAIS
jgi:histidyl-tRNA synthetase